MTEIASTKECFNPNLGFSIANIIKLKAGYNFPYKSQYQDAEGITFGLVFSLGSMKNFGSWKFRLLMENLKTLKSQRPLINLGSNLLDQTKKLSVNGPMSEKELLEKISTRLGELLLNLMRPEFNQYLKMVS